MHGKSGINEVVSTSRRGFLKVAALAGAAVAVTGQVTRARADIDVWAKDLSDGKLVEMFTTILCIRWHSRTMPD